MKNLLTFLLLFLVAYGQLQAQCNPDVTAPEAVCVGTLQRDVSPNIANPITITAADFNAGSFDACDPSNTLGYFIELAPQSATPPATTALTFDASQAGTHTVVLWVVDSAGNATTCNNTLQLDVCSPTLSLVCNDAINIQLGVNNSYTLDAFDILEGGPYCDFNVYKVNVDQAGFFETVELGPDDIGVHLVTVSGTGNLCWGTITVAPSNLNTECPQLNVDLASNNLRPCFNSNFQVYYGNASVFPIADTWVEVTLDNALVYQSSSLTATPLGNNRFRFETGDLAPGQNDLFSITVQTDCNAVVGTTHCAEARIFPDTICEASASWSGAEVAVEGKCINNQIQLTIKNIGNAPTTPNLGYVVVEDVLMLTESQFSLGSGASFNLPLIEGTGATYRLEAQQEPGYPYGGVPSVSIEGCGGLTPGMVTIFPTENSNPAIAQYCRESTAAYDPNDKQGWPKGVGDDHFIKSNTAIDYMIRFQNTGTDTAFTVVLVDTLPLTLNPKSVRMGAASHPYTFELASDNILRIRFDNILLPHEAINEAGSQGFVQFNIQQQPDHTDGTVIENSAAIYFDFNAPIITNTTRHTIGSLFLGSVATNEQAAHLPQLKVFPNPTSDVLFFESKTWKASDLLFTLSDAQGRTVVQRDQVSLPMTLQRGALQNGVYFFQFNTRDGQPLWTGKVLVK